MKSRGGPMGRSHCGRGYKDGQDVVYKIQKNSIKKKRFYQLPATPHCLLWGIYTNKLQTIALPLSLP